MSSDVAIKQRGRNAGNVFGFRSSGELRDTNYEAFAPAVPGMLKAHDQVRPLARFQGFHGLAAHAVWDNITFAVAASRRSSGSPWLG